MFFQMVVAGLLRLQQIYQGLQPGNATFQVETVKRISNISSAIDFLKTLEEMNRWSRKYIVLDCPTDMAKEIVVSHVRDVSLGRRTYHYLLSGLVSISPLTPPMGSNQRVSAANLLSSLRTFPISGERRPISFSELMSFGLRKSERRDAHLLFP